MERAGRVDTVVLDKTGTLTAGRPQIAALWLAEGVDEMLLFQAALAVEQHSRHPLAQALLAAAAERGISPLPASAPYSEAGAGLEADVVGIGRVRVGKPEFCGFRLPENLEGIWQIASVAAVSADGKALGAVAFADTLRPDSTAAVARLQAVGIEVRMMSGDRPAAVAQIANELGLAAAQGAGQSGSGAAADGTGQGGGNGRRRHQRRPRAGSGRCRFRAQRRHRCCRTQRRCIADERLGRPACRCAAGGACYAENHPAESVFRLFLQCAGDSAGSLRPAQSGDRRSGNGTPLGYGAG